VDGEPAGNQPTLTVQFSAPAPGTATLETVSLTVIDRDGLTAHAEIPVRLSSPRDMHHGPGGSGGSLNKPYLARHGASAAIGVSGGLEPLVPYQALAPQASVSASSAWPGTDSSAAANIALTESSQLRGSGNLWPTSPEASLIASFSASQSPGCTKTAPS
jgi:hypothetical protein